MKLSRKNGPIYLQVKQTIKDRILTGQYKMHTNIPSQEQLELEFGVSKITIRNAVEELVVEGYLDKQMGKGTEVIDNKLISKLSKGKNFTQLLTDKGYTIEKKQANISIIDTIKHTVFQEHFGDTCYFVSRLYYLNDQPYVYFSHYLPIWLSLPLETEPYKMSLYHLLSERGITFNKFIDEFDTECPDDQICEALQIQKQPLLKRIRYTYDDTERLIEYSEAFYNTNIHRYVVKFDV